MRIVIDMQGAQSSGSRQRGIGRYTTALTLALARNRGAHEVILALNGAFTDSIDPIKMEFRNLIPKENIHVWHPVEPASHIDSHNDWNRLASEKIQQAFIRDLNPDIVLYTSLFEGLIDSAISSIHQYDTAFVSAVILYDLIPLIHQNHYLSAPVVKAWYDNKLNHLKRADLQLAISASSRQESIEHLKTPPERVVNISSAVDSRFRPQTIDPDTAEKLRSRFGLKASFVMYTGGIDHRKNIEGLVLAFAKLAPSLRVAHQLAVVCSAQDHDRSRLLQLAKDQGLVDGDLVLTGFVSDEDLFCLYNLCTVFVFPSWHEGFGLPALEAMACGRAVIASDCSSLPEVIGRSDALFNPHDPQSIADKLTEVLTDASFRAELEAHGVEQATQFGWDKSAAIAIQSIEQCVERKKAENRLALSNKGLFARPRLAFVSPLPPDRTGIADYSAELLPELAHYYDIVVILPREVAATPWIQVNCPQRDVTWFRANASRFDRVIYHFGNSSFHQHMFSLLSEIPGTVVLHDFFLSGVIADMELQYKNEGIWSRLLYISHGYYAVRHRFKSNDPQEVIWEYPCNLEVLQQARGVIIHSNSSRHLGQRWYGPQVGLDWHRIPLLRTAVQNSNASIEAARKQLGFKADDFVVCSFGLLGPTKLNHRLLQAWLNTPMASDPRCFLVFVGENHAGAYGEALTTHIKESGWQDRIKITGWTDPDVFQKYLCAADVGVQLRSMSRGETSASALDCMNHGLATLVNANGSMADLPDEQVWKIADEFSDEELTSALVDLYRNPKQRVALGERAHEFVRTRHSPSACAVAYRDVIEACHQHPRSNAQSLIADIAIIEKSPNELQMLKAAEAIDKTIVPQPCQPQLLVDISYLMNGNLDQEHKDLWGGVLRALLNMPHALHRVEPIYAEPQSNGFRYARTFTLSFLGCRNGFLNDELVDFHRGDCFLGLEFACERVLEQRSQFKLMHERGVEIQFAISPTSDESSASDETDHTPAQCPTSDKALRNSSNSEIPQVIVEGLSMWASKNNHRAGKHKGLNSAKFNAKTQDDSSHGELSEFDSMALTRVSTSFSFFLEADSESSNEQEQLLTAFEGLWQDGQDITLVVIEDGYAVSAFADRLHDHPRLHTQLVWRRGASDAFRERLLAACTCQLIVYNEDVMPFKLMDAARHDKPLWARDLPVVRHIGKNHVHYLESLEADRIRQSLGKWIILNNNRKIPLSNAIPWLTQKLKISQLLEALDVGGPWKGTYDTEMLQ